MKEENIVKMIKDYISENNTEEAIKYLSDNQYNYLDKEVIILSNRFNKVNEELRFGTLSREEANRELIRINLTILELTEIIKVKSQKEIIIIENPLRDQDLEQKEQPGHLDETLGKNTVKIVGTNLHLDETLAKKKGNLQ